ncbi:cytochrome c biogenesis protein ResB, partial [Saccharothrix sp. MB29]|nr:cytochrome c biogenesis protein ResB [Saccharothrix sp. MB29]
VSAERGYLRETGNLVFHFSLLGLLIAFALGKMFGYEGQVIVPANGGQFCNSGVYNYDSFRPGLRVDGTDLNQFCVKVDGFDATYLHSGQAESYRADLEYQSGDDLATGTWRPYRLEVNSPLRTAGDRVYLIDHGYTPLFTVTFPDGQVRTGSVQWRRLMLNDSPRPTMTRIANTRTHTWVGSWDTWSATQSRTPSNRIAVPSSRVSFSLNPQMVE